MSLDNLQQALESLAKGGININGDLVLEKHVEHEIGNVESGGIGIQIINGRTSESKASNNNAGRPKRAGKTINKAFFYDAEDNRNTRLQLFFQGLIALNWIKHDTDLRNFLSIFSGGETTCRIIWTGDINALAELFKELVTRKQFVKLPVGESIWLMVNARFWDHEGNKEFGNEKLGATRSPVEQKDNIDTLVEILNPDISIKDLQERLQSQY